LKRLAEARFGVIFSCSRGKEDRGSVTFHILLSFIDNECVAAVSLLFLLGVSRVISMRICDNSNLEFWKVSRGGYVMHGG
jgi:hypothetical protein